MDLCTYYNDFTISFKISGIKLLIFFSFLNASEFDIFTHKKSGQSGKVHWRGNSDHVTSHSQKQFGRTIEPKMY